MSDKQVKRYKVHGSWIDDISITQTKADMVMADDHDRIVSALRAENEALRKDAERYRWLRDPPHDRPYIGTSNPWCVALFAGFPTIVTGIEIDSPIDTALAAREKKP